MITKEELKNKVGGTIFTVKFIKKTTGELRTMKCRFGVSKGVVGTGLTRAQIESDIANNHVRVYDVEKQGWRTIPLNNIEYIAAKGEQFSKERIQTIGLNSIILRRI